MRLVFRAVHVNVIEDARIVANTVLDHDFRGVRERLFAFLA